MNKFNYFVLAILTILNTSIQASNTKSMENDWTSKDWDQLLSVHTKVFEMPSSENASKEHLTIASNKIRICEDKFFINFLNDLHPKLMTILESPSIKHNNIQGHCLKFFSQLEDNIIEVKQGQACIKSMNSKRNTPFYVGTTHVCNCVGVVLDCPTLYGFMHVDMDQFDKGRFDRLLNRYDSARKADTRVFLTSSYFSPLLNDIVKQLDTKGFRIFASDVDLAYILDDYRLYPACSLGISMDDVRSSSTFQELYSKMTKQVSQPKFVLYDFTSRSHISFEGVTPYVANLLLEEYFKDLTSLEDSNAVMRRKISQIKQDMQASEEIKQTIIEQFKNLGVDVIAMLKKFENQGS